MSYRAAVVVRMTSRISDSHTGAAIGGVEIGSIERVVRADIASLGELVGVQPSLAALAYRLASALDSSQKLEGRELAPVANQLRATLEAIAKEAGDRHPDPAIASLSTPVYGSPGVGVPSPMGNGAEPGSTDTRPARR